MLLRVCVIAFACFTLPAFARAESRKSEASPAPCQPPALVPSKNRVKVETGLRELIAQVTKKSVRYVALYPNAEILPETERLTQLKRAAQEMIVQTAILHLEGGGREDFEVEYLQPRGGKVGEIQILDFYPAQPGDAATKAGATHPTKLKAAL